MFCGVFWIQVMWPDATAIKFRPQDLGSEPCWISVIADRNTDAKAVTSTCLIHPPLGLFPHLSISNLKSCGCKEIIQTKNTQVEKSQLMLEKKKKEALQYLTELAPSVQSHAIKTSSRARCEILARGLQYLSLATLHIVFRFYSNLNKSGLYTHSVKQICSSQST